MDVSPLPSAGLPTGKWLRYRRVPTWRTWLAILLPLVSLGIYFGIHMHGWLSLNAPLAKAKYYVVEGWMPDYAVVEGGRWFQEDHAKLLLTSGGPLDRGAMLSSYRDFANVAANTLAMSGVNPQKILPSPCGSPQRERTRVMAETIKAQLDGLAIPAADKTLNLVSLGVHARRSLRVYRDVLGPDWTIGIYNVPDRDYDPEQWWKTSEGARSALTELIALAVNRK